MAVVKFKNMVLTVIMLIGIVVSGQDTNTEKENGELKVGDEAPKFALLTLEGNYETLSRWCGKQLSRPASQPDRYVVVASFFATWCSPCMKELPHLQNLYEKYEGQLVKFFLIDITEATRTMEKYKDSPFPGPFLKEKGMTLPILIDRYGMAMEKYVPDKMLPRLFVMDKYRTIRLIKRGFTEEEDFEKDLSGLIDELLGEALITNPPLSGERRLQEIEAGEE
tara:strand:+ start:198 stop:866 length:669 start_codon:yes stop_codon:yes gene_type:complete